MISEDEYFLLVSFDDIGMHVLSRVVCLGARRVIFLRLWEFCLDFALEAFFVEGVQLVLYHNAEEHCVKECPELGFGWVVLRIVHVPK